MDFPKSKILSAGRLAQLIKESNENGDRFCFILGSGASVESRIPSGNTLEMRWMNCLMGEADDNGTPAMDAGETRRAAAALLEEKQIEHEFKDIEEAWEKAKKGGSIPSAYYFDIYKLRFYAKPRNGYSYLERIMERCEPSLGYHTLAKLLTETSLNNLVITTNFDSLVEDALFLYTDKKPLVVSHESLADYMEANIQRPIIAKVHRGLLYAPFNSPETTHALKDEWKKALSYAFNIYSPVVIGYAGGDRSLMAFLEEKTTTMRNGVYWCYREKSGLPGENIQQFVQDSDGYLVTIDGFDALMMEIGKTLYEDAIRPSQTEKHLKEKHDRRVQRYNDQWEQLNQTPEMEEVLRPMNEAEQREEEEREEKRELTASDYFRRGKRAKEEGRLENAIEEYSKSILLDPSNKAAYNNRGTTYDDLKQYQKAIEDFDKAIELDQDYAIAYNNRGISYKNSGQYSKAIEDFCAAIRLDPDYALAYSNRSIVYVKIGKAEHAVEDCNKAISLDPANAPAYLNRGFAYDELVQYDKAILDYSKALELNPDNPLAYNNRGVAYEHLEQYEKALADYTKAIDLDPNYALAYRNRGDIYRKLGQEEKASQDYKKAKELEAKSKQ